MNLLKSGSSRWTGTMHGKRGFALVVTLSLMLLLVILAVGLMGISSIALRSSAATDAMSEAKANARLALLLAIGDLQKYAGKDQAVTAEAGVLGDAVKQPHWTGVWDSADVNTAIAPSTPTPTWLVSGTGADPAGAVADPFTICKGADATNAGLQVQVPVSYVAGKTTGANPSGRYAYWVSDEGVKARLNVAAPAAAASNDAERLARAAVAQEANLAAAGTEWKSLQVAKNRIVTMNTSALASVLTTGGKDVPRNYQYDLTTDGYGLPVDVSAGGFKKDLTTIFDDPALVNTYLGGVPTQSLQAAGGTAWTFTGMNTSAATKSKFYLVDAYSSKGVGPNWGILYNYYNLYKNVSGATCNTVQLDSVGLGGNIRSRDWPPYNNSSQVFGSRTYSDTQHKNSEVQPVVSLLRMGFHLGAVPVPNTTNYRLQLHVKPIVGLWNPYNVRLPAATYEFDWAVYSYLRLKITQPDGTIYEPRLWLREIALNNGTEPGPPPRNYSALFARNVDFAPGEFRAFSVNTSVVLGSNNDVVPSLGGQAAFFANLNWNSYKGGKAASGSMIIPKGSQVTISEMLFDDLQTSETLDRWPKPWISANTANSDTSGYLTMKMENLGICSRYCGMWVPSSGTGGGVVIPEKFANMFPTKTVEQLVAEPLADPDASWEVHIRTSDQKARALRCCADANPRAHLMNPLWDGSNGTNGWWYSSPFVGGGPNATGLLNPQDFQVANNGGRFNHFGGNSIEAIGQNNVALFDVPRAPLVSLAQFQHAEMSRYNFEPAFVVGNSFASLRIPPDQTLVSDYARDDSIGLKNFTLVDSSYLVNRKLWDSCFFSTLSARFKGVADPGPADLDAAYPLNDVKNTQKLPNPRLMVVPLPGDTSFASIKTSAYPAEAMASRITVPGAFNVNSTSKTAWKAVLGSLAGFELPVAGGTGLTWKSSTDARFSHFGPVVDSSGYDTTLGRQPPFWLSYRKLGDSELDSLAAEIVKEVKARGPFRSLAEFVNRNPNGKTTAIQSRGALQAALDRSLNAGISTSAGAKLLSVPGMQNGVLDMSNENQAAGNSAYITQADVLQTIGPSIQPRSDCFRIRAMGEVRSPDGKTVIARAVCEAIVQRGATYVDPSNAPEIPPRSPSNPALANPQLVTANQKFGRRYQISSFRWLPENEI